jgi:hypothetical protein
MRPFLTSRGFIDAFRISFLSYPAACFEDSEAQEMVDEKIGLHRRARIEAGSPPML